MKNSAGTLKEPSSIPFQMHILHVKLLVSHASKLIFKIPWAPCACFTTGSPIFLTLNTVIDRRHKFVYNLVQDVNKV